MCCREEGAAEQPVMRWMTVNLEECRKQQRRESAEATSAAQGGGTPRGGGQSRISSMHSQYAPFWKPFQGFGWCEAVVPAYARPIS